MSHIVFVIISSAPQYSECLLLLQMLLAAEYTKTAVEIIAESDAARFGGFRPYPKPVLVQRDENGKEQVFFGRSAVYFLLKKDIIDCLSLSERLERHADLSCESDSIAERIFAYSVSYAQTKGTFEEEFVKQAIAKLPKECTFAQPKQNVRVEVARWKEGDSGPKEPKKDSRNILITSALPYVNNAPHLGNIIGAVLSGDVFARYCRLRGYTTLYICGTDEYGTATETKALEEKMSCADVCAKYYKQHASVYEWFQICFDFFGRTSTPQQTEITHGIFHKLYQNGYFFEEGVEQTFCEACSRFLADRYVEGACPLCGFADARGDQCDGCGKLVNPADLRNPRCKLCRSAPVVRTSRHLFLDLTRLQPQIDSFVTEYSGKGKWSANSISIARAWLAEGLKPRCMTRDLKWGTPVPVPGYEEKVFYVWFDAPIGYISITACYTEAWREWWQNPQVQLYQFMGKDNVPFHTVTFPASLIGTGDQYTLLHHLSTTEYLNYETGKFSKSRGVGVFGDGARDSGIPASIWRYYLLAVRPETTDAVFSWDDFAAKTNSELLANLGNFVNRTSRFIYSKCQGTVRSITAITDVEKRLADKVQDELNAYIDALEHVHLKAGLKAVMSISALGNHYLTEARLDSKLLESDPSRCHTVLAIAVNLVYLVSSLLDPFLPGTANDIRQILNAPATMIPTRFGLDEMMLLDGHEIREPFLLLHKIEQEQIEQLRKKFNGKQ